MEKKEKLPEKDFTTSRRYYNSFTLAEQAANPATLFLILRKSMGDKIQKYGFCPVVWCPSENPADEWDLGYLGDCDDISNPAELYTKEEAMKFIAIDAIRQGHANRGDFQHSVSCYDVIPVITGIEPFLRQPQKRASTFINQLSNNS